MRNMLYYLTLSHKCCVTFNPTWRWWVRVTLWAWYITNFRYVPTNYKTILLGLWTSTESLNRRILFLSEDRRRFFWNVFNKTTSNSIIFITQLLMVGIFVFLWSPFPQLPIGFSVNNLACIGPHKVKVAAPSDDLR